MAVGVFKGALVRFKGKTRLYYVRRVRCTFKGFEVMLSRGTGNGTAKKLRMAESWLHANAFELVKEG